MNDPEGRHPSAKKSAASGFIVIAAAKLFFMFSGWLLYFLLPRLFESSERWGTYVLVSSWVSLIDNVIVSGTVQGVSHFVAQHTYAAADVKRTALRFHSWCGLGISAAFFCCATPIAHLLRDPALVAPLRSAAGIIACYSFYSIYVGVANGRQCFTKQAALDGVFAAMRVSGILLAVYFGLGVVGAFVGWTIAAVLILAIAIFTIRTEPSRTGTSTQLSQASLFRYVSQLLIYTFLINVILRTDLYVLKRGATDVIFAATKLSQQTAVATALAGYYGICQALAMIPYQAIFALTFIIFPILSKRSRAVLSVEEQCRRSRYISQALRFTLLLSVAIALPLIVAPTQAIRILYPARFEIAGPALRFSALALVAFSMLSVTCTVINALNETKQSIVVALTTTTLSITCNLVAFKMLKRHVLTAGQLLITAPGSTTQTDQTVAELLARIPLLTAPAIATAIAVTAGLSLSLFFLYRTTKAVLPPSTILRVFLAAALPCMIYMFLPQSIARVINQGRKLASLATCMAISCTYLLALLMLREITVSDIAILKRK